MPDNSEQELLLNKIVDENPKLRDLVNNMQPAEDSFYASKQERLYKTYSRKFWY